MLQCHTLYQWQGVRSATFEGDGVADVSSVRYQSVVPGTMTGSEYDAAIRDLTNFMVYLELISVSKKLQNF